MLLAAPWTEARRHWMPVIFPQLRLVPCGQMAAFPPFTATLQADAEAVALLDELQWPDRRQAAIRRLAQLGFPAIRDGLQALVTVAEALRQLSSAAHAEAATGYALEDRPNVAEWPDMAAAATLAPCGAAYWARHAQRALCVQHCAQELRRRLLLHDAVLAEYARRNPAEPAASAAERLGASAEERAWVAAVGTRHMERALQQYEQGAGPDQPRLSELSKEQLRRIVQTTMEEGALALAQVHRPATGGLQVELPAGSGEGGWL